MSYIMRTRSLFVLTLLQLCQAEISDTLSESWYSGNVIHDGVQPKPLPEIFSTPPAFSSTNPIVVLSNSSPAPNEVDFSTVPPPQMETSNTGSTPDSLTKFTLLPSTVSTPSPPVIQTLVPQSISTANLLQSRQPQIHYQIQDTQPLIREYSQDISSQPIPQQTLPPSTPLFQTESQPTTISIPPPFSQRTTLSVPQLISQQTTLGIPQPPPPKSTTISASQLVPEQPALPQSPIRFDLAPLTQVLQRLPEVSRGISQQLPQPQTENRPNYILIYQQAPQYLQGETMSASQEVPQIIDPQPSITSIVQPISTLSSSISSTDRPTITSSIQPIFSSTQPTIPPSSPRSTVFIQPSPTIFPSSPPSLAISTSLGPDVDVVRALGPCNITGPSALDVSAIPRFPLKIRVVAPKGSITNVVINPLTTTTRRPTTMRTRKPKRNTYESCVNGCKGNRKPICGIPLSTTVIDTNTLKGFPSVCHMACHNSYRKQAYEQLLEGRCGLLRTRIRTIDSNTKLKRDELNKAQYFVDKSEPQTIFELSGDFHK